MTVLRKEWQGQEVDQKFPLQQWVGGSERSAVFQTETGDEHPEKAAIKLIPADAPDAEAKLARWRASQELNHRNLLRVLASGRSTVGGAETLYVVTEWAEEDLSQILPQRALTAEETRGMLEPVLDALEYLHAKGLAQGRIKPANVHAVGDQVKLASDAICQSGASRGTPRQTSVYDAPEMELTPASDVWSLGVTLVEALTQRPAVSEPGADAIVPETLPAPFSEIAQRCLQRDPRKRWNVGQISARLSGKPVPAAAQEVPARSPASVLAPVEKPSETPAVAPVAVAKVDAVAVPLSPVPPARERAAVNVSRRGVGKVVGTAKASDSRKPKYWVAAIGASVVIVALVFGPKLVRNGTAPAAAPDSTPAIASPKAPAPTTSAALNSKTNEAPKNETTPQRSAIAATGAHEDSESAKPASQIEKIPTTESLHTSVSANTTRAPVAGKNSASTAAKGEVLEQVMPQISQKARDTIRGTVRVGVLVHVGPSGEVTGAELDGASASKYFADAALQAARKWNFQSPELDGRSVPSEWRLRFEFSPSTTRVTPAQLAP